MRAGLPYGNANAAIWRYQASGSRASLALLKPMTIEEWMLISLLKGTKARSKIANNLDLQMACRQCICTFR